MTTRPRVTRFVAPRARNALRRRPLMLGVALVVACAVFLSLWLLERQAVRSAGDTRARALAALPLAVDTLLLQRAVLAANDALLDATRATDELRARQRRDSSFATTVVFPSGVERMLAVAPELADLAARLEVAQSSRILESLLSLGEATLLSVRDDAKRLMDSLRVVQGEERLAAASTAIDVDALVRRERVKETGDQLIALARTLLAEANANDRPRAEQRAGREGMLGAAELLTAQLRDSITTLQSMLQTANGWNAQRDSIGRDARVRSGAPQPVLAMVTASGLVAAAVGFLVAMLVELRQPRLADAAELQLIAREAGLSSSLVVQSESSARIPRRRASDQLLPRVLREEPAVYARVHHMLYTMGDAATALGVVGESPEDTAAVALAIAAAAADSSRLTLLIDGDLSARAVAQMAELGPVTGLAEVAAGTESLSAVLHTVTTGRECSISVLTPGRGDLTRTQLAALEGELQRLIARFDLTVLAVPADLSQWPPSLRPKELVIAATAGSTAVSWIRGAVQTIATSQMRLRALILRGRA